MCGDGLAALRAEGELPGRLVVVSPPAAGFLIRLTSLGNCHDNFLPINNLGPPKPAGTNGSRRERPELNQSI